VIICWIAIEIGSLQTVSGSAVFKADAGIDGTHLFNFVDQAIAIRAKEDAVLSSSLESVTFSLADGNGAIVAGSSKRVSFNVVDISQCTSFYIQNQWNNKIKNNEDTVAFAVVGKLADGSEVAIPNVAKYVMYEKSTWAIKDSTAWKVTTGSAITLDTDARLSEALDEAGRSQFLDYSVTNADGTHPARMQDITITAKIYQDNGKTLKDTVKSTVSVSNYAKHITALKTEWFVSDNKAVLYATSGEISTDNLLGCLTGKGVNNYDQERDIAGGKDAVTVTVSKYTENTNGLYDVNKNNQAIVNNTNGKASIKNAEIGDTFEVTFAYDWASLTLSITVGNDVNAKFNDQREVIWR